MMSGFKCLVKRVLKPGSQRAVLGARPYGGPENSEITFVVVCRKGFHFQIPNANSTIRLGYCRAFAEVGVRYHLVDVFELNKVLPGLVKPFVFLSAYDYLDMGRTTRKLLRQVPHFVWVTPDIDVMKKIYAKYSIKYINIASKVYKWVSESEPAFVWAPVPPSALQFYSDWEKYGMRLESLPQACDTARYFPDPGNKHYEDVQIAYVGGYWPKKAVQFDKYLKPYEELLTVFGYSQWPYKGYQGLLPDDSERLLYQNARVSPSISEPHTAEMGDILERVFKVLGSGGLTVTDVTPFYRELFSEDELLVPNSLSEYHNMISHALNDKDYNEQYRHRGYKAIMDRHTYAHRARTILSKLDIPWEEKGK